jgi:hypothetical protein
MLRQFSPSTAYQNAALALAFTLVYAAYEYLFNRRVFFITDGWWEFYADIIRSGSDPYLTSGLKITPLHSLVVSALQEFATPSLLGLRDLFSFIHLVQIILIFWWARGFGSFLAAIFAVSLSSIAVMQGDAFISKDYHTTLALLIAITLLCSSNLCGKKFFTTFIKACVCALLFLTKQNVGVFVALAVAGATLIDVRSEKAGKIFAHGLLFIFSFLSMLALSLVYGPNWTSALVGNDAKGGLIQVLFRFASDPFNLKVGIVALFIFAITLVTERNFILIRRGLENLSSRLNNYGHNTSVAFEKIAGASSEIFIKWIFLFFSLLSFFLMPAILLSIALAWPAVRVIFAKDLEKSLQTSLLLYTIAYCGTQTAGYNPSSMEPLIVLLFCETWPASISWKKNNLTFRAAIFCFFVFSFGIQLRTKILEHGYSWWGLKTAGLFSGNQSLPTDTNGWLG